MTFQELINANFITLEGVKWTANREVIGSNLCPGRNQSRFCYTCASGKLNYDEYNDHTLSVGR